MIKLADTLAPLADFPAAYAKDIEFDDGKNLQEKLNNGELGGGGTSITVDTAMSSTSTNPVQNKVIKAYVDGKSVDISADSDNAIQTKTDGIYVEKTKISTDDGNALSKKSDGLFVEDLSNKVNALNIAQKTINEDLDYCFVGFWNNTNSEVHATCTRGAAIPFNTKFEGNLDFNSTNKAIKLKAGHRYKLHYQCKQTGTTVNANHMERFYNETTSEWLKMACNCDTEDETHTMEEIYVPTVDCEVSVRNCWCPVASFSMRVNCVNTNPDGPGLKTIDCESAFIVTEIGKTVTIDPVEYVDSTKGIEDTPVGEIIRTIGNKTPKHYLMCDGSTHNIADYPYLAQYFKDTFGAINAFGGDGTTTFGVPDKSTDTWWTPGLVNGVVPSPYAVYVSSVFNTTQHQKELLFDGIISADSCWHSKADGSDTDIWVKFDFGKNTYIQGLRMAARSIDYLNQLPSTFTIEGSYDDVTYTVIKSYSRLPSPTSTNFREHLFDKPVNYRYYKLNHMTSNAKNNSYDYCSIAELEFSKVDNIQYIKAEPTYFMNLEGVEVTEDLLTDKSFDITTNGVTTIDKSFTLPTPITDFDEIETVYSYEKTKVVVKDSVSGTVATATELTPTSNYKGLNFPGTSTSGITYQTIHGLTYPLTVEIAFSSTSNSSQLVFVHDVGLNLIIGITGTGNYIQLATKTHASKTMGYDISNWNLNDGNFHTITVTYNSANSASLYFDGVLKPSITYSNTWTMTNISSIGNRFNSAFAGGFEGTLYAVRFYNGILSQSDIVASYNSDKDYVLNNTAQIARNNLACEYKLYDSVEIIHPYITSSKLSVRDIEYNSVLSVDKSVQNVTNNKAASTELQYTFIDKNNVKFLNVSNHYNDYLPSNKFGIRRLTGIKKISK